MGKNSAVDLKVQAGTCPDCGGQKEPWPYGAPGTIYCPACLEARRGRYAPGRFTPEQTRALCACYDLILRRAAQRRAESARPKQGQ